MKKSGGEDFLDKPKRCRFTFLNLKQSDGFFHFGGFFHFCPHLPAIPEGFPNEPLHNIILSMFSR
jgi:hypothetical protein